MNADKILLANLYIALKTKPLAILAGPEESGKEALVEKLANTLSGRRKKKLQLKMLTGHPWWAKGDNIAELIEFQARFTSEMVMRIFQEVQQPRNYNKAFLVCFARISPAELQNLFADLAFQIQNNRIMRLGDIHFDIPVIFPNNLYIIGTMNTDEYRWWDAELLLKTSVIQMGKYNLPDSTTPDKAASMDVCDLMSPIRETNLAYKRLKSLFVREKHPFEHFLQVKEIMLTYNVSMPDNLMDDAVIYLANAWSSSGEGLFTANLRTNFDIATDILITQLLLPRMQDALRGSSGLRQEMLSVLQLFYPSSFAYLSQFP